MTEDLPTLSPAAHLADSATAAFPLNRVVALATPVLASSAAVLGGWLVDSLHLGGGRIDEATRRSVMLAASASATVMAYKWLDGWQQYEEQEFSVENGLIPIESADPSDIGALDRGAGAVADGAALAAAEPELEGQPE